MDRIIQDWCKIIQFFCSHILVILLRFPARQTVLLRYQDTALLRSFSPMDRTINHRVAVVYRFLIPSLSRTRWRDCRLARCISTGLLRWRVCCSGSAERRIHGLYYFCLKAHSGVPGCRGLLLSVKVGSGVKRAMHIRRFVRKEPAAWMAVSWLASVR